MTGLGDLRPPDGHNSPHLAIDQAIDARAASQHRVVAHAQLIDLGLSANAISKRVAARRMHRVHRGVFAVGPLPLGEYGMWMAAVLACGPGALLSHRSAAALWGVRPDSRRMTDVTTSRQARRRDGITVQRTRTLAEADTDTVRGIPCTSLARTLLDLAEVVDRRALERALDRAEQLGLLDMRAIEDVLARNPTRRGARRLRRALADHYGGSTITKNEIEELFLQICRQAGLPQPEVNVWLAIPGEEWQVDFLWRRERLVVETDGRKTHGTRQAFERDRRRDQRLMVEGWRVVRFTWRQITREPEAVAATLRGLLAQARAA
ncbi:MAG: DUF559 domain-containing protein [Solirubrobacteraceae bacterium]